MKTHSFTVSDPEYPRVAGFVIEVRTMTYLSYSKDEAQLESWISGIADDFVAGKITREELLGESIRIRLFSPTNEEVLATY